MIPGLDGLRAIALLFVLGTHTGNLEFGWIGVQLFFVLSGFLITGILIRMKETQAPKAYFTKFYGRRFLRIFPLYYFYLFLLFGIKFITPYLDLKPLINEFGDKFWMQVWPSIFYVYNFFHASASYEQSRFFTHLWSLSVEEQFYITWPLILFLTPKDKLKKLFISAIIIAPFIRGILYLFSPSISFITIDVKSPITFCVRPHRCIRLRCVCLPVKIHRPPQFIVAIIRIRHWLLVNIFYKTGGSIHRAGILLSSDYKSIWGYSLLNYLCGAIYSVAAGLFCVLNNTLALSWQNIVRLVRLSHGNHLVHS
jgi:peptidoglycan/LPS O-acetylase OafA/YrhL